MPLSLPVPAPKPRVGHWPDPPCPGRRPGPGPRACGGLITCPRPAGVVAIALLLQFVVAIIQKITFVAGAQADAGLRPGAPRRAPTVVKKMFPSRFAKASVLVSVI